MIPTQEQFEFEIKHKDLLNTLTMDELYWLNQMVVDRIKLMQKLNNLAETSKFRKGEKVTWQHEGSQYVGWVRRINQKTLTVTETQEPYKQWRISPGKLTKVV